MELLAIARGHIILKNINKTVTIYGEAFFRGYNAPDFVVYSSSIDRWDVPNNGERVSKGEKRKIVEFLQAEFAKRNMVLEIE